MHLHHCLFSLSLSPEPAQRLFKKRPGASDRGAESVFGGTGLLSDDEEEDEGDDATTLIRVKGPLEFLRHPQVGYVSSCPAPLFPSLSHTLKHTLCLSLPAPLNMYVYRPRHAHALHYT